jgi:plasmid stabilization system protein ParE
MRIRWTPVAAEDLKNIYDYLMEHEPQLARPTVIELRQGIRSLKQFRTWAARDVRKAPASFCTSTCRTPWCIA